MSDSVLSTERILVVDDQATHRQKMKLAVEALGYTATTANNGHDALSKLKTRNMDLVLLDIL